MTRRISAVAVCCSSASVSSRGAVLDPLLQAGVGLSQPAGHPVELVGQRLQLVAGADLDPVVELAGADPGRAGLQRLDRLDQPPGQHRLDDTDSAMPSSTSSAGAPGRGSQRLERLLQRLLDEHQPAERRDRRVGGQHLAALEDRGRSATVAVAGARAPAAAFTCVRLARSVFCSTRLMSGCAMSAPLPSTT